MPPESPNGWLALLIVLDQFTRNALRNDPRMYAGDARAQKLAMDALDDGRTLGLPIAQRHFAMMPLAHAEALALQERSRTEVPRLVEDAPADLRPLYAMGVEQTRKMRGRRHVDGPLKANLPFTNSKMRPPTAVSLRCMGPKAVGS